MSLRRATFSTMEETEDITFAGFEQNPETAILLHLMNSGNAKFEDLDNIDFDCEPEEWDSEAVGRLVKQVLDEVPSEEELCNLLENYFEAQGRGGIDGVSHSIEGLPGTVDAAILSCGSCGVRRPQRSSQKSQKMIKVSLHELVGSPLEYSSAEKDSWEREKCLPPLYLPHNANGDLTKFDTWKLRSAFDSNDLNTTFHLHPELA